MVVSTAGCNVGGRARHARRPGDGTPFGPGHHHATHGGAGHHHATLVGWATTAGADFPPSRDASDQARSEAVTAAGTGTGSVKLNVAP